MRYPWQRILRGQRGANLIEMALVTTLLLLLFGGIADLGRAFHSYIVITNAAREGARMGARVGDLLNYSDPDIRAQMDQAIKTAVIQEAAESGVELAAGDVGYECLSSCVPGNRIRVWVTYEVPMFLGGVFGYGTSLTLTGYAEMMIFGHDLNPPTPGP